LTPRLRGLESGAKDPIYAYSEAGYELNNHWLKVVRDRRFKLVFAEMLRDQRWIGGEGVKFVLYDLLNDPGETKNVADRFPEDLERLKRALWKWEKAPHFEVMTEPPSEECKDQRQMDPKTVELLHSLGYL